MYKFAILRPITTVMFALAIVFFGLVERSSMPSALYPNVDFPIVIVTTVYKGANADIVESKVTDKIEEALSGSRIADVIEGVQYQQEELCRKMKGQIDNATRRDQVKPREGVRLLELYESQMLNKTYLNIASSGKKKK